MPDQDVPAATPVPRMSVSAASLSSVKSDLAIAFLFEADRPVVPGAGNGPLQRALSLVARQEGFRGKRREVLVWHSAGRFPSARYMLAGLGPKDSFSTDAVRDAFGAAARRATATPARTPARVAAALPAPPHAGEGPGTEAIA
ncbi:MAG TPA: M17 family peptidase N-terminal domain-containing protein, partial [Candidatus Polarisedimenticolia bacterium]|nr:M17 family peptidase N-terminal domain-containing protein [Candidatus Polarisedimenticolia bacterium]